MSASQDWRDGCATGAAAVESRVRAAQSLGIPITLSLVQKVSNDVRYMAGGYVDEHWLVRVAYGKEENNAVD